MERMEFRYEELCVFSVYARSCTVDRCREPSCESRYEHCDNQGHSHRGWGDSSQETLPRFGDERERTSIGIDQRNLRHERSIGMESVDYVNTIHFAPKTHEHIYVTKRPKRLRNIVHNLKHIPNNIETNVTNSANDVTHTDAITAQP